MGSSPVVFSGKKPMSEGIMTATAAYRYLMEIFLTTLPTLTI
jgi:hypothetical protein